MNKLMLALAFAGVTTVSFSQEWSNVPVPPNAGNGKKWQLQANVSDDFNYNFNEVHRKTNFGNNKWYNFYHNAWDGPGTTYWKYNHVSVDGDDLVLRASRWSQTNELAPISQYAVKMNRPNGGINAGCITSNNKVKYPVYVEAAVSVANIALATDIWLLSPDDTQEIDIIECYGGADSGNAFFAKDIHLSHHSFVRVPFQDYQPRGHNSWWTRSDITSSWGNYCWNNGNRKYVQIGVNWIGPKHFEYYIDGQLIRVLYDKACATKNGNTWYYTYPSMTNGVLDFNADGYQRENQYATSSNYNFNTLKQASNTSRVSVIDPYNYQGGNGFTKDLDIIINVESQNWHVDAGRTPNNALLNDPTKNQMKVDWIRVYKPVDDNSSTPDDDDDNTSNPPAGSVVFEAESFANTGGTFNDGFVPFGANKSNTKINYVNKNDWMDYNVNIPSAGEYRVTYSISSPVTGSTIDIIANGNTVTTSVPNNGQWDSYRNLNASSNINLQSGNQTIRIKAGGTNWTWNLDKVTLTKVGNTTTPDDDNDQPGNVITVQAESFSNTSGTFNDGFVPFGANKSNTTINYVNKGDVMEYVVNVPENGNYEIVYYISSPVTGSTIDFLVGNTLFNTTTVPNNGQWDSYRALKASGNANLTAGNHLIKLRAGSTNWTWNLDKFTLQKKSAMLRKEGTLSADLYENADEVKLYPNPFSDIVYITSGDDIETILFFQVNGSLVKEISPNSQSVTLDTSGLNSGLYLVKIKTANGEWIHKRISKN